MTVVNRFLTMLRELLAEYLKIQSYRWQSNVPEIVDDHNHLAVRIHSFMEWTAYVSSLGPHLHEDSDLSYYPIAESVALRQLGGVGLMVANLL